MSAVLLADVKAHLIISDTASDQKLQGMIDAAELYAANRIGGPLVSTAVTQRCPGYRQALVLNQLPVLSVTSVTDATGAAMVIANLDVDKARGLINWNPYQTSLFQLPFYAVVYQAGYTTIPADLALGVKERVRYQWLTQVGPNSRGGSSADEAAAARYRADEIFDSYITPGFA